MPRSPRGRGRRIQLHDRTVDDTAEIIDAGIDVAEEHYEEIMVTEAQQIEDRTRREYRNRIKHVCLLEVNNS